MALPRISLYVLTLIFTFFGVTLMAGDAFAVGGWIGTYSCSAGVATGQLFDSGPSCPTTLGMDNFFSFLVCNMEQLSSNLMGHMYCGMIHELEPAVWAVATLAVAIFGVGFMIGVIPATGRDAILFLIKLAFITGFATNADLLIGVGYKFLITGMRDGVIVVLEGIGAGVSSVENIYGVLDGFLKTGFHYATDSLASTIPEDRCKNAIFAVMATMAVAFPIIAYLGLLLLGRIVVTFFRAIFGYIYALVGITFLLCFAPFFLSFFLFQQTRPFFDKWLGYLVSFALQIVLLFSFLAFILSLNVSNLTSNLTNIIMYQAQTVEGTSFRLPWQYCTLCDFKVVDKDNPGTELSEKDENYITKGQMVCKTYPTGEKGVDSKGRKPITLTFAVAPGGGSSEMNALMKFAGEGMISLIILAVVVERLLAMLPALGQKLASSMASYAPQLGGGESAYTTAVKGPADGLIRDFNAGFNRGFGETASNPGIGARSMQGNRVGIGDGISSTMEGVKDGVSAMIRGKRWGSEETVTAYDQGQPVDTGMRNGFMRWMTDPNRFKD